MMTCPVGTFPYTIRAGDTFWKLAQRFHTSPGAIAAMNPGLPPRQLRIGETLCIPGPPSIPPRRCPPGLTPYVVKPGDTIGAIAWARRIPPGVILRHNPVDPYNLQIGQVLCIPRRA